jgi:hypothetical protein
MTNCMNEAERAAVCHFVEYLGAVLERIDDLRAENDNIHNSKDEE